MEEEILSIIRRHPGCSPGFFNDMQTKVVKSMIVRNTVVVRYSGMMPHYYTPEQIADREVI